MSDDPNNPEDASRKELSAYSESIEQISIYDEEHTLEMRESEVDSLIPSEHKLAGIEKYVPGGAARFLTMIEENGKHRRRMNAGRLIRSYSGLGAGLVVACYCLYLSAHLIMAGHDAAGGVLGTLDLVALTTVFVVGRKTTPEDDSSDESEE